MKPSLRIVLALALFTGILTVSSPNYAGTLLLNPALGIGKNPAPGIFQSNGSFRTTAPFAKKKAVDPYAQALKIARALSTSA